MVAKPKHPTFEKETDLCAAFLRAIEKHNDRPENIDAMKWTPYCETAGWDILLVSQHDGSQIGIEAKLKLNTEVLAQCLDRGYNIDASTGPDFRAILVPYGCTQNAIGLFAERFGVTVIRQQVEVQRYGRPFSPDLPTVEPRTYSFSEWTDWLPMRRCELPDYVPDVIAGDKSPLQLSPWKIQALKIAIILESRPVLRSDFKTLKISPTRWLDKYLGWLAPSDLGYVATSRMPDFKAQHGLVYEQVKADAEKWMPGQLPLAKQRDRAV